MQNARLKIWSCIALLVVLTIAGFQGDNRLASWTTVEVAAQPPPQECKDAAGATIPCPPADDEDRGRTDCEDTDRDGVCDLQEPRECVGQLDELGNGCAADDDIPGAPRTGDRAFYIDETGVIRATYLQPSCNDEDFGSRAGYLKIGDIKGESTETPCPDPEPEFDCRLIGPFALCSKFAVADDSDGILEGGCKQGPWGEVCWDDSGDVTCAGQKICAIVKAQCGGIFIGNETQGTCTSA